MAIAEAGPGAARAGGPAGTIGGGPAGAIGGGGGNCANAVDEASELAATVTATAKVDSVFESIVFSILDLGLEHRLGRVESGPVSGRRIVRNGFRLV
ncbi:hypothetical protein ACVWY3_003238 [Bradyrhizobium sp. USDA 4486]